jgi:hypothetical protein
MTDTTTPAQTLTESLGGVWHTDVGSARCPVCRGCESLAIENGKRAPLLYCAGGCDKAEIVAVLRTFNLLP